MNGHDERDAESPAQPSSPFPHAPAPPRSRSAELDLPIEVVANEDRTDHGPVSQGPAEVHEALSIDAHTDQEPAPVDGKVLPTAPTEPPPTADDPENPAAHDNHGDPENPAAHDDRDGPDDPGRPVLGPGENAHDDPSRVEPDVGSTLPQAAATDADRADTDRTHPFPSPAPVAPNRPMPRDPSAADRRPPLPSRRPPTRPGAPIPRTGGTPPRPARGAGSPPPTGTRWQRPGTKPGAPAKPSDGKLEAAKLAKDAVGDVRRGLRDAEGVRERAKAGMDTAEKAARAVAAAKTGGASERILRTKPGQIALKVAKLVATANLLLPLALLLSLAIIGVVVIAAYTEQAGLEGDIEYSLRQGHPMSVEDGYLDAYRNAAADQDLPWTLLAAVGKVATDHGRSAPGDIVQYGAVVDRAPYRGELAARPTSEGKSAPPPGSEIVVVGDSLVGGGRAPLDDLLDDYTVTYDYANGRTISGSTQALRGAFAQRAPVVVVQAGVNDVYNGVGEEVYRPQIEALLDEAPTDGCVVWVNLQNFYAGAYDALDGAAQRFNAVLAELAVARPWVSVADFAAVSASSTLQSPDGLHPNAAGYRVWADTVMRTVLGCMPAPASTIDPDASGPSDTEATPSPEVAPEPSAAPTADSSVKTDPRYAPYDCEDNVCGPTPQMGGDGRLPVGPMQIDPAFLRDYEGDLNPHDIRDAAQIVAEALAERRDALLESDIGDNYREWRTDPTIAAAMWAALVEYAPVKLPAVSLASLGECRAGPTAGPQGALLAWPLSDPTSTAEYGAQVAGTQVTGMLLTSSSGAGQVLAAAAGTVADVQQDAQGAFVLIAHGDGFTTRYANLTEATVGVGDRVEQGAPIATAADAVLFETLVEGSPRNPRLYVANAESLPAAGQDPQAGTPLADPQAGTPVADPQAGSPIDRCSGLARTVTSSSDVLQTSNGRAAAPTGLVIPVAGVAPEQLSDTWGAARSGGRRHQGIDIVRPIGTPVLAAAAGSVKSNFSNGQPCNKPNAPAPRSISILGTDGNNYYYGHMDQIFVTANQQVAAGEIIGTVGDTGNACHSVPHLHFSINEGRPNVMNPYPLLVGAQSLALDDFAGYLDATTLSRLSSSAAVSGAAGQVVAYAWFYGGLVKSDPNAGRPPGPTVPGVGQSQSDVGDELAGENPAVAAVIRQYFPPEQWDNAIRLANCESRLNPDSVSRPNSDETASRDWGLFQLNDRWVIPKYLELTGEDPRNIERALDPHWNAKVASMVFEASGGWGQWTCAHHPTDRYPNLLGLVSMSPKMEANGGRACRSDCFDYGWDEPGPGDTAAAG